MVTTRFKYMKPVHTDQEKIDKKGKKQNMEEYGRNGENRPQ